MTSPHPTPVLFAIIGGSGVYNLKFLSENTTKKYYKIDTPFGEPSDEICVAEIAVGDDDNNNNKTVSCAFLPRHGRHHVLNPTEINYRANLCALKILGVRIVLAINAVGSLDSHYTPGDLTLVSQLIDRTVARPSTFFEKGCVAHVDFAHPTSAVFTDLAFQAMQQCFPEATAVPTLTDDYTDPPKTSSSSSSSSWKLHRQATAVTMEGPQFSTKAESLFNKHSLRGHLIGMTTSTECKLAREAEIIYVAVAMVTDNDAWSDAPHVDVAGVIKVVKENGEKAQRYPLAIMKAWAAAIEASEMKEGGSLLDTDPAANALQYAVMTHAPLPDSTKERLRPLLQAKYPQHLA